MLKYGNTHFIPPTLLGLGLVSAAKKPRSRIFELGIDKNVQTQEYQNLELIGIQKIREKKYNHGFTKSSKIKNIIIKYPHLCLIQT